MKTATIPQEQSSAAGGTLYVGVELSAREWRLAYSTGLSQRARQVVVKAGDRPALREALAQAKKQCGLAPDAGVCSCYEAGRDRFWPHRLLEAEGVTNTVVDSSSIEVNRRARRAKTDRLDAAKLLRLLLRFALGEREVWHVVHVPRPDVEEAQHGPRTVTMLTRERTRWRNRIHSLLATVGVRLPLDARWSTRWAEATQWDGAAVPPALRARVDRAWQLLQQMDAALRDTRQAQRAAARADTAAAATVQQLTSLRGIGPRFAWVLATEVCSRDLHNRREVGALTGFTSVPYRSGTMTYDQGISRTGLVQVRGLAVETAWIWVHWQPRSALTQWFDRRFAHGGHAARQIGIVALARRLVIALWRYHRDGVIPAGAVLNTRAV
jgi:transposase